MTLAVERVQDGWFHLLRDVRPEAVERAALLKLECSHLVLNTWVFEME